MGPRKGPRPEANPRPIFQGLVIAVTSFKGGEWNETNMSRWISLRKGRLSSQVDASVTHLICSEEDVKNKHPKVREAQKRGIKKCKLVTLDWLEDSMHAKRVLPEGDFSPQKALLKAKKIEARKKKVEKGFEQAVKTVNTNLYHHYQDHTYFTYVVTLRRDHVTPGERYVLFLEESNNSKPHLYWFFAKYYKNKGNTYAHVYRPSFTCGRFQREFDHFKNFFKTKTGIDWDDRLIKEGMAPADKKFFHYTSPVSPPFFLFQVLPLLACRVVLGCVCLCSCEPTQIQRRPPRRRTFLVLRRDISPRKQTRNGKRTSLRAMPMTLQSKQSQVHNQSLRVPRRRRSCRCTNQNQNRNRYSC
ncbi:hypothetical protein V8F33_003952 [Rhypophila sp. PSN 637]